MFRILKDVPEDKAKELVLTALELWDRVYQAWVMTSLEQSIGPKVTSSAVFQTWGQFLDGIQKTPGMYLFLFHSTYLKCLFPSFFIIYFYLLNSLNDLLLEYKYFLAVS